MLSVRVVTVFGFVIPKCLFAHAKAIPTQGEPPATENLSPE